MRMCIAEGTCLVCVYCSLRGLFRNSLSKHLHAHAHGYVSRLLRLDAAHNAAHCACACICPGDPKPMDSGVFGLGQQETSSRGLSDHTRAPAFLTSVAQPSQPSGAGAPGGFSFGEAKTAGRDASGVGPFGSKAPGGSGKAAGSGGNNATFSFGGKPSGGGSAAAADADGNAGDRPAKKVSFVFGAGADARPDPVPAAAPFSFSKPSAEHAGAGTSAGGGSTGLFSFGDTSAGSKPGPMGASKPAAEPSSGLFSFGGGGDAAAGSAGTGAGGPAKSQFSFGSAAPAASAASGGLFSFGGAPTGSAGGGGVASAGAAEEDDEAPKKFESEVAVNEDAGSVLFKAKVRSSGVRGTLGMGGACLWRCSQALLRPAHHLAGQVQPPCEGRSYGQLQLGEQGRWHSDAAHAKGGRLLSIMGRRVLRWSACGPA